MFELFNSGGLFISILAIILIILVFFKGKEVNRDIEAKEKRKKKAQRKSDELIKEELAEWLDINFNKCNSEEKKAVSQLILDLTYEADDWDGEDEDEVINLARSVILKHFKDTNYSDMPADIADCSEWKYRSGYTVIKAEFKARFLDYQIKHWGLGQ